MSDVPGTCAFVDCVERAGVVAKRATRVCVVVAGMMVHDMLGRRIKVKVASDLARLVEFVKRLRQ